jgi:predicted dinucleotide-binding enzyme
VFRYEEYSKMLKRIEESSSDTVIIDITNIDITDAEEAEATIYSAYPELLL